MHPALYSIGWIDKVVRSDENITGSLSSVRRVLVSYVPRDGGQIDQHSFTLVSSMKVVVRYSPPKEIFETMFRCHEVQEGQDQLVSTMIGNTTNQAPYFEDIITLPFGCEKIEDGSASMIYRSIKFGNEVINYHVINFFVIQKSVEVKKKVIVHAKSAYMPGAECNIPFA